MLTKFKKNKQNKQNKQDEQDNSQSQSDNGNGDGKFFKQYNDDQIDSESDDEVTEDLSDSTLVPKDRNQFDNKIAYEKFPQYNSNVLTNYIVPNKLHDFNSKSTFCYFLWSGINELGRWELNRKINPIQETYIYKEMVAYYKKNKKFDFVDPIHLAIKKDNIVYVMDGQHRVIAYNKLCGKNKYPIQQIPCVLWYPETEEEFIEIFDKINSRTPMDKTKLFNYKINDIIIWMDKNLGNNECIWGKKRPKIDKDLFVEKMRDTDSVHKLETGEIIDRINKYNIKLRGMSRNKRNQDCKVSDSVHTHSETMDFFLGYDKELKWIGIEI